MPGNQSSDNTAGGQWYELNSGAYFNYVQTLYLGKEEATRIARALNRNDSANPNKLVRPRRRLQVKPRTSHLRLAMGK
jgi:hypothetical protein